MGMANLGVAAMAAVLTMGAAAPRAKPTLTERTVNARWQWTLDRIQQGRYEEAERELDRLFRLAPGNPYHHHARAYCAIRLGKLENARRLLKEAAKRLDVRDVGYNLAVVAGILSRRYEQVRRKKMFLTNATRIPKHKAKVSEGRLKGLTEYKHKIKPKLDALYMAYAPKVRAARDAVRTHKQGADDIATVIRRAERDIALNERRLRYASTRNNAAVYSTRILSLNAQLIEHHRALLTARGMLEQAQAGHSVITGERDARIGALVTSFGRFDLKAARKHKL
jgi:tetratricopeptide (TPR) repeat protein